MNNSYFILPAGDHSYVQLEEKEEKIDYEYEYNKQKKELENCQQVIHILEKIKNDLLKENTKFRNYFLKWQDLLETEGINSKLMVLNDIQFLLKGSNK